MLPDQSHDESYEEFLQYFLRDQSRIFAYVRCLLPQYSDAQDVFQRCSLTLWKQFDKFDRERLFLPWACGIAFNEVRNFRRVSGRDRLLFSDDLIEQLSSQRLESLSHRERRSVALRACIELYWGSTGDTHAVDHAVSTGDTHAVERSGSYAVDGDTRGGGDFGGEEAILLFADVGT